MEVAALGRRPLSDRGADDDARQRVGIHGPRREMDRLGRAVERDMNGGDRHGAIGIVADGEPAGGSSDGNT